MLNVLIAESEELELGGYEVIGVCANESEARDMAASDMHDREKLLARGGSPMCPYVYKMHVRGMYGYSVSVEFNAAEVTA
jgi:hypothetical protein